MALFVISLQSAVCLLWLLLVSLRRHKTRAQKILIPILLFTFVSFMGDYVFYNEATSGNTLVWFDAISQFVTPCIAPLVMMYICSRYGQKINMWGLYVALALPVVLGVTSAILYGMIGLADSAEMMPYINKGLPLPEKFDTPLCMAHVFVEKVLFYAVMGLQMLAVIGHLIWQLAKEHVSVKKLCRFIAGKEKISSNAVIVFALTLLLVFSIARCAFASVYYCYEWAGMIISLIQGFLLVVICNVELNVKSDEMPISFVGGEPLIPESAIKVVYQPEPEPVLSPLESMEANNAIGINMNNEEYAALLQRFNSELVIKKAFLDENITLNTMVEILGINRSYLSYLVNKEYGMPFRDVVAQLRMEFAMQYMRENPNCLQETVARASGFSGASAFNRKFSQVVGMTPRLWYLRNVKGVEGDIEEEPEVNE